jgi:UDP-3-O-[3-hydroxymyristoyl] glucosamine N-acyltransferase
VIKSNTIIGNNVTIGCNCTIGGAGFGYEKNEVNEYKFMPHLGGVKISDNVNVGDNCSIDKGVLENTFIGEGVKIDNLVHIAHGVQIGSNSLIIANTMIGGSASIGKNVWVAPSASLINKIKIGDAAIIGMGAVVIKDVDNSTTVAGNPAKPLIK